MGYSTPYIILNIILIILSILPYLLKKESSHKQVAFLSMVVFVVFFSFRGYVQTDTLNYYDLFLRLPNISEGFSSEPNYDKGFLIYMAFIKLFGLNYNHFIFISSIIDLILLTILFRHYFSYKYYAFFLYLFLIFTGLEYEFNLMRNIKSVLLFLISVRYIYSRDFWSFITLNLIGLSFHWTSIVFFPLYFFLHKELSLKSMSIYFVIGVLIYFMMPYLLTHFLQTISKLFPGYSLTDRIGTYLELTKFSIGKKFSPIDLALIIWYFIILLSYNKIKNSSVETICFLNLFVLYFLFSCMSSGMIIFRQRVAVLFEPSCWLLFIWLIKSQKSFNKILCFSLVVLYGMLLCYRKTNNDKLYYYDNFILSEKVISIEERGEIYKKIKLDISKTNN